VFIHFLSKFLLQHRPLLFFVYVFGWSVAEPHKDATVFALRFEFKGFKVFYC